MKNVYIRFAYFGATGILVLLLVFLFFKKGERKKRFSELPEFFYTEIDGYKNTTTNLPQAEGYAIFIFNPGCEACQMEAKDISDNIELFDDNCLLFLSPDSLSRIKSFMIDCQLYEKENVLFGNVNLDTIDARFGKSAIPWLFVYNKNKRLIKSEIFVTPSELEKLFSK